MPIPSGGLVTKLDFSDPSCYSGSGSTVYDLVGNNDFDILNSPTFVSDGQKSYFQFTASTNKLQTITPVDVTSITVFTFSVWAMSTGGSSAVQVVFGSGLNGPAGGVPHIALNVAAPNVVNATFGYGVSNAVGSAINQNQWYLLTMTCDGTTNKIYVNGTLAGSAARGTGSIGVDPTNLVIGQYSDVENSLPWIGRVGAYYYYDTALSATDVLNLYNSTYLRFSGNQVAIYDFSDSVCYPGSGSTVFDLSASEYDLTISGSPTFGGTGQSKYFEFNGNAANVIYRSSTGGLGDTFSVNMWFQFDTTASVMAPWAAGLNNSSSGNAPFFSINYLGAGVLNDGFNYGVSYASSSALSTGTWYMATSTYDGTTNKLYINGALVDTEAQGTGTWPSGGFVIGQNINAGGSPGGFEVMDGKIAILEIFNTTFSAGEISTIYTNESSRFGISPPVYQGIVGGRQFAQGFNG